MHTTDARHQARVNGSIALTGMALAGILTLLGTGDPGALGYLVLTLPYAVLAVVIGGLVIARAARWSVLTVVNGTDPGFFAPPRSPAGLVAAAAWLAVAQGVMAGHRLLARDLHDPSTAVRVACFIPAMLYLSGAVVLTVAAWLGLPQVWLRPDGVEYRTVLGTCRVPWTAFDTCVTPWTAVPTELRVRSPIRFVIAHPGLVSYRRWGPGLLRRSRPVTTLAIHTEQLRVAPKFLADAIVEYILRPQLRVAIGTAGEAQRFEAQRDALLTGRVER